MSDPDPHRIPMPSEVSGAASAGVSPTPSGPAYAIQPLMNLSAVSFRMDSLHCFLSESVNRNVVLGQNQMDFVSSEISSAIHQVILNGAALLAASPLYQIPNLPPPTPIPSNLNPNSFDRRPVDYSYQDKTRIIDQSDRILNRVSTNWTVEDPKPEPVDEEIDENDEIDNDYDVVELDSVELLAEHVHLCEICGKGFKRDANLRMHMRAHGDQYKRPEALSRPVGGESSSQIAATVGGGRKMRFSCPFGGCNRNKQHKKFKPLKSVICVKNHFKRTHCPKMYACTRCHKKSFSVLADLKSHLKYCGESKWKCSCGTTFSRKDKLFGHMALFEGHMPAISDGINVGEDGDKGRKPLKSIAMGLVDEVEQGEDEVEVEAASGMGKEVGGTGSTSGNGLDFRSFDRSETINDQNLQDMLGCFSPDFVQQFCNF